MSGGKHTPGPWYVSQVCLTNGGRPITTEDGRICTVDCQTPFKRGEGWQSECDVREANARLIAAAPDLLDLAKAYEKWEADVILSNDAWEPNGTAEFPRLTGDLWYRLVEIQALRNAAIAKAEGGAA